MRRGLKKNSPFVPLAILMPTPCKSDPPLLNDHRFKTHALLHIVP